MGNNSILVIRPYRHAGTWVFDDLEHDLVKEPFVQGIPEIIDQAVRDIPNAAQGFRLLISSQPFPGYLLKLDWRREEYGGNWYWCELYQREGWLCPALFEYVSEAPKALYVKAEQIKLKECE